MHAYKRLHATSYRGGSSSRVCVCVSVCVCVCVYMYLCTCICVCVCVCVCLCLVIRVLMMEVCVSVFGDSCSDDGSVCVCVCVSVCVCVISVGNTRGQRAKLPLRNIILPLISLGEGQKMPPNNNLMNLSKTS